MTTAFTGFITVLLFQLLMVHHHCNAMNEAEAVSILIENHFIKDVDESVFMTDNIDVAASITSEDGSITAYAFGMSYTATIYDARNIQLAKTNVSVCGIPKGNNLGDMELARSVGSLVLTGQLKGLGVPITYTVWVENPTARGSTCGGCGTITFDPSNPNGGPVEIFTGDPENDMLNVITICADSK
ncbi:unnamed protein product [Orchesella dallaii]|uniref:Uncharacterized protein n=1 Tax=Orchesella dallaii TaxID=48710 RepID=A0ABP1RLC6_9HEXA